jgi:hypothetical protein
MKEIICNEIRKQENVKVLRIVLEWGTTCQCYGRSHIQNRRKEVFTDTNRPGEQVLIDLAGPYMVNRYSWTLLVAIDCWSRETCVAASRRTSTSKDIKTWI